MDKKLNRVINEIKEWVEDNHFSDSRGNEYVYDKELLPFLDELEKKYTFTVSPELEALRSDFAEIEAEHQKELEGKGFKCCICERHSFGWGDKEQFGNNPYPLKTEGQCCDDCNIQVILERIKRNGI